MVNDDNRPFATCRFRALCRIKISCRTTAFGKIAFTLLFTRSLEPEQEREGEKDTAITFCFQML